MSGIDPPAVAVRIARDHAGPSGKGFRSAYADCLRRALQATGYTSWVEAYDALRAERPGLPADTAAGIAAYDAAVSDGRITFGAHTVTVRP